MTGLDPYVVLGVRAGASKVEIDDAFHALAKLYHPDANPGDAAAERSLKEISAAHALLCDPVARARLDGAHTAASGSVDDAHGSVADSGDVAPSGRRSRHQSADADQKPYNPLADREFEFTNPFSGNAITLSKRKLLSSAIVLPLILIAVFVINALEATGKLHIPGFASLTKTAQSFVGPRQASVGYSPVRTFIIWVVIGASAMGAGVAALMKWVEYRANRPD
jgi:hypothetical protein